jgi:hypothetical protein
MQSPIEISYNSTAALRKALSFFAPLIAIALCATGCGNSLYALRANAASNKLEEARNAGAEQRAPYEYTLAKEHLDKAMSEAAEADYGDAYTMADAAYDYADKAVERCKQSSANAGAASGKESAQ